MEARNGQPANETAVGGRLLKRCCFASFAIESLVRPCLPDFGNQELATPDAERGNACQQKNPLDPVASSTSVSGRRPGHKNNCSAFARSICHDPARMRPRGCCARCSRIFPRTEHSLRCNEPEYPGRCGGRPGWYPRGLAENTPRRR